MIKYLLIVLFFVNSSFANDLAYKDRSNLGENKFERIGKLEAYVSGLSKNLSKIHDDMKKEFKKELKALEDKLKKEREADLSTKIKKIEAQIKAVSDNKDYAKKGYSEETRGQLKTLKNRIIDLLKKVKVLEDKVADLGKTP